MTNRKRQFGGWIVGLIMALPLLYVLSFGPACWWFPERSPYGNGWAAPVCYWPLGSLAQKIMGGNEGYGPLGYYATLFESEQILLYSSPDRKEWILLVRGR